MPCNEITNTDMILLDIFGITNNGLLALTALLTGVALVFLALFLAGLLSPRSFNPQKGEAYECGIPTRGEKYVAVQGRILPVRNSIFNV